MKNPGVIIKLPNDERTFVVYNNQPFATQGKVMLNIVDENHNPILGDTGKPKVIFRSVEVYNEEAQAATLIGYID